MVGTAAVTDSPVVPSELPDGGDAPACPICAAAETVDAGSVPDYVDGRPRRQLHQCTACGSAYAVDRTIWPDLYEAIYRHAATLPGYRRYSYYASLVDSVDDPLAALAELDEVYEALTSVAAEPQASTWKVLELGCGLGYTTASLRKRGLDVVGADISETAVAAATQRYGPHFRLIDPDQPPADWLGRFDLVVATEVIEHVDDPAAFVDDALRFLTPTGRLLITTPHKPAGVPGAQWDTDAPPVHLFWLTRAGLSALAERAGMEASFVAVRPRAGTASKAFGNDHTGEPILAADFGPLRRVPFNARVGAVLRRMPRVYVRVNAIVVAVLGRTRRRRSRQVPSSASAASSTAAPTTLVAMFRRPAGT